MEVRSGALLAGFRVEEVIGAGATGTVYRAVNTHNGERVALKVLAPELARDERFRQRFLRESQIAATLVHSHVAATPGAVTQEVNRCLTMVRVAASRRSSAGQPRQAISRHGSTDTPRGVGRSASSTSL